MGERPVSPRELFLELLKKRRTFDEPEAVLLLVSTRGKKNGEKITSRRGVFKPEENVPAEPPMAELRKRTITLETLRTPHPWRSKTLSTSSPK